MKNVFSHMKMANKNGGKNLLTMRKLPNYYEKVGNFLYETCQLS